MQAAGLDVSKYSSTEELLSDLLDRQERANQAMQALAAQRQPPPAEPAAPPPAEPAAPADDWSVEKHFSEAWQMPQRDAKWDAILSMRDREGNPVFTKDPATGLIGPSPGNEAFGMTFVNELHAMNSFEQARSQQLSQFVENNPHLQTWNAFQEPMRRMFGDVLQQGLQQLREELALAQYRTNGDQPLFTPDNQLTEQGQQISQSVDRILAAVDDPMELLKLAELVAGQNQPPPAAQPPAAPPAAPAQAAPAAPAQPSWLEQALQAASHNPSASGAASAPPPQDDPGQLTEYEVQNAFTLGLQKEMASA
jgi:hypothetical protein